MGSFMSKNLELLQSLNNKDQEMFDNRSSERNCMGRTSVWEPSRR
jgi:hypothetical protein